MDAEDIKLLERTFVDGYRRAEDKLGFLKLSGIPMELERDGRAPSKLIEVQINDAFTVGSAAPGFGSKELVYHPLPDEMVTLETALAFLFVHAEGTETYHLAQLLTIHDGRDPEEAAHAQAHAHGHHHHHPH